MNASGEGEEELPVNNGCLMWYNNKLAPTVLILTLCPAVILRQDCVISLCHTRVLLSEGH